MSIKTSPMGPFLGMNNRLPADKLLVKDKGAFVRNAVNVDVTTAGTLRRRPGTERVVSGTGCHSLFTTGGRTFMVEDTSLVLVSDTLEKTTLATVIPNLQMSYAYDGRYVRASNGVQSFRINADNAVSDWSVPTPQYIPLLSASTGGSLPEGQYRVVVSFTDAAGEEGATTVPASASVPEGGVLQIDAIPQLLNHTTNVYLTAPNDSLFFRVAQPSGTSLTLATYPTEGPTPTTLLLAPLPAGHIVRYYNARMLIAQGSMLFYSEPYQLGLYQPTRNYIQFDSPITLLEASNNGFYVAATQTYWIGGEITEAELVSVLNYDAIPGTSGLMADRDTIWWMSERGLVMGTDDGKVENLQEKDVAVNSALVGASLYREQDGLKQMVSTLFSPQSNVMAASSFMEAEVLRKEKVL